MRRSPFNILLAFSFLLFSACNVTYQPASVQFSGYRVSAKESNDSAVVALLRPYYDSVNKTMNDVIAVAGMDLTKKQPEGTLNNVLADAMLAIGQEKYGTAIDAAFVNYGGVRLTSLPAGNITRSKIFEVAPFDNIIVLQKLTGSQLQLFLDLIAERGGWPAAGVKFQIKKGKAINVFVGNKPLDQSGSYTIALLDYVANGGEEFTFLKSIPQQNNGYLFRDAVISYFSKFQREGKMIKANLENRISNAE